MIAPVGCLVVGGKTKYRDLYPAQRDAMDWRGFDRGSSRRDADKSRTEIKMDKN
jgi:hypothetical protein